MINPSQPPPSVENAEVHRIALQIMGLLHGMPVGQADFLLSEVKRLLHSTTFIDITSRAHAELIASVNAHFGDDVSPQMRQ